MSQFNIISAAAESTVVAEYTPDACRSDSYQSEAALEQEFLRLLCAQGYEYLEIHDEAALIANLRRQLEGLNDYAFSDSEWTRFFKDCIAGANDGILEKTRRIQLDHVQVLRQDSGASKNIYLLDKKHIHNHIYWNSTALDCTKKFKNFIGSYRAVRRLSDLICAEHRLSVVENPQKHGLSYNKWRGGHDKLSNRDLLRMAIDAALEKQPQDFDALLALLKDSGYSVARKGRLSLRHENQKQSIRLESLGEGYSEQELRAVLAGSRTHKPFVRKKYPKRRERATLISDIEAKLNAGKGYRYDQAMKVVKLKQMAKTLIYLEEKGFADFDALVNAAADAEKRFYDLKAAIKTAEARMGEIQTLRTHIMNYSRTRSVYTGYRKAGYSKKYLAEHEGDILIHKAAKKAFDAFGLKKLPTVRSLNEEFARLLAEKKAAYAEYHRAQEQMRELLIHKANAACLLGLNEQNRQTTERQREEK